ncbi:uncharacterized protein [Rutidosis leptorrhynchoides]|uniref:uncharacterized protein n=1 Tax=Rutidosis leptorrhynchoides TaxID=125765 RepID=UPI003A990562
MEDINYTGLQFTWNQRPHANDGILKKIDRVMANDSFVWQFTDAYVIFQPYRISDHCPMVLKLPNLTGSKPKPFKFSNYVVLHEDFKQIVVDGWSKDVEGHMMFKVVKRLRMLKKPIRKLLWLKGNIYAMVETLRKELDQTQIELDKSPDWIELHMAESLKLQEFKEATLEEERFLKQKSKVEWLRVGDSNSSYFHKVVKGRIHCNYIQAISDHNNNIVEGRAVCDIFIRHYEHLIRSATNCDPLVDPGSLFQSRISVDKLKNMVRQVTNEEIKAAIFDIGNDKAPGW